VKKEKNSDIFVLCCAVVVRSFLSHFCSWCQDFCGQSRLKVLRLLP